MRYAKLIAVFQQTRDLLARPDNNFDWSSWPNAASALAEVDMIVRQLRTESLRARDRTQMRVLFAPTGPIQEVSLSSGWAQAFLAVAAQFDEEMERAEL